MNKKKILMIVGSASNPSSNLSLVKYIVTLLPDYDCEVYTDLQQLPHFNPEKSVENTPKSITEIRQKINQSDGILICTPEYIFSIPSGLKNLIEWCVSTVIFDQKPTAIITASAHGQKAHEELQLIMKTVTAKFTNQTTLLIQGIKGKINAQGQITDLKTQIEVEKLTTALRDLIG